MALTEAQKVKVRVFTGRQGWASSDTALEGAFALIDGNAQLQLMVEASIEVIEKIRAKMVDLIDMVDLEKAEENLARKEREKELRNMGRQECNMLASMCGLDVVNDIFSPGAMSFSLPMS